MEIKVGMLPLGSAAAELSMSGSELREWIRAGLILATVTRDGRPLISASEIRRVAPVLISARGGTQRPTRRT